MKYQPKLSAFYCHQPEVPEGAWPRVNKTQYVNLALIRTDHVLDFGKEYVRWSCYDHIDDIVADKDDIQYDDVFTDVNDGARLLFEGRPGCGKTTMMHKISQDWSKGKIFSSCLLFLVHLRQFGNNSDIELTDLVQSAVNFTDEEVKDICTTITATDGKGVVFILDGLDEYCPKKKKDSVVYKIIERKFFSSSVTIVASRPAASRKYRGIATKCVEVLGFLKKQIYDYIESYFSEGDSKIQGLKTYLDHHPNVMHMCYLPLHVAMIVSLYEIEGDSLPQTETEIYDHFTHSILLRSMCKRTELDEPYLESCDHLSDEDKPIFEFILKIAFQATVINHQQVFRADDVEDNTISKEDIRKLSAGNDESTLGLIVVDRSRGRKGVENIFTFPHLTFQEYLAACHIARCTVAKQEEIIQKHGHDNKLNVVWKFYCGMMKLSDSRKEDVFKMLISQTSSDGLLQLQCAHESQQVFACSHVVQTLGGSIQLKKCTLNPADCTAIAYVLVNSNNPASELGLTLCNIGPEGYNAIVTGANENLMPIKSLRFVILLITVTILLLLCVASLQ